MNPYESPQVAPTDDGSDWLVEAFAVVIAIAMLVLATPMFFCAVRAGNAETYLEKATWRLVGHVVGFIWMSVVGFLFVVPLIDRYFPLP